MNIAHVAIDAANVSGLFRNAAKGLLNAKHAVDDASRLVGSDFQPGKLNFAASELADAHAIYGGIGSAARGGSLPSSLAGLADDASAGVANLRRIVDDAAGIHNNAPFGHERLVHVDDVAFSAAMDDLAPTLERFSDAILALR
jgi:hypothetical protein